VILAFQNRKKISAFAEGCQATWTDLAGINSNTQWPMIFSGVTIMAPVEQAHRHGLDYWYIDSGYLGNHKLKTYLRVCKNSIHASGTIVDRSRDRLDRLQVNTTRIQRGDDILIVPPDVKQASHWPIGTPESWLDATMQTIKLHTDRRIRIRQRPPSRTVRQSTDTFLHAVADNVHAVVTFVSGACVESVLHDVPVISLGPSACVQVSPWSIDRIDQVPNIDTDLKEAWMRHLSYCQFTEKEMQLGQAWRILNQV
jgi:hypothetical protein